MPESIRNTLTFSYYSGIPNPDVPVVEVEEEVIILASDEISVGVEVELENLSTNWLGSSACRGWDVVNDGSLRGVSREIRSEGPVRGAKLKQDINMLFNSFVSGDLAQHSNMRTSMHVHVNMLDMTRPEIVAFLATASLADSILFQHTGENRPFTGYSSPTELHLAKLLGESATRYTHTQDANGSAGFLGFPTGSIGTRYRSVNLQALTKHGTVEFRHFETPATKEEMVEIINACMTVKLVAKQLSTYLLDIDDFSAPDLMYDKANELLLAAFPDFQTTMDKENFCELFELGTLLITDYESEEPVDALFPNVATTTEESPPVAQETSTSVSFDPSGWAHTATNAYRQGFQVPGQIDSAWLRSSYATTVPRDMQPTIDEAVRTRIGNILGLSFQGVLSTAPLPLPLGASMLNNGAEIFRGVRVEAGTITARGVDSAVLRDINRDEVVLPRGSMLRLGRNSSTYAVLVATSSQRPSRDTWVLVNVNQATPQEGATS